MEGKNQKGQALIIILLAMAVVLTVVMSSVSRSVTEVSVTSYEEDSLRAFSAAEAGIEETLLNPVVGTISSPSNFDPDDSSVTYSGEVIKPPSITVGKFLYPKRISAGESAVFWLADHDSQGRFSCKTGESCFSGTTIYVCWGDPDYTYSSYDLRPAIEVSIYYDITKQSIITDTNPTNNYSNFKIHRVANDSYTRGNDIPLAGNAVPAFCGPIESQRFSKQTSINVNNLGPTNDDCAGAGRGCVVMVSVRMLYSDSNYPQPVAICPTGGFVPRLPSQGLIISSTGQAGESTRKVDVFQSYLMIPELFDLAVYSGGGLAK